MKIAIVHPSQLVFERLAAIIAKNTHHEILWFADNGLDATLRAAGETPDLILMNLSLPKINGVEATADIMRNNPSAILLMTSSLSVNISLIFEAMGRGAVDVIDIGLLEDNEDLKASHKLIEKIGIIEKLLGKSSKILIHEGESKTAIQKNPLPKLLVIGSSTGGPAAIAKILSQLSKNSSLAIIIIQHVDEKFSNGLAQWLTECSHFPVEIAQNGSLPHPGVALLAGKNNHLVMRPDHKLRYQLHPKDKPYRPSVDVFFDSLADNWQQPAIAVLLTGMGNDGAEGLRRLQENGWHTIVEHQDSCVVFGMPKAAIELDAASIILPIEEIGPHVLQYLQKNNHLGN